MKNYSIGKIFPTQCPGVTECADGTWTDRPADAPRLCMRHGGPRFPIPKPEKVKAPRPLRPKAAAPVVVPSAPIAPPAPPTLFDAPAPVVPTIAPALQEWVVWGMPPGAKYEDLLLTKLTSRAEAERAAAVLREKHGVINTRVSLVDISQPYNAPETFLKAAAPMTPPAPVVPIVAPVQEVFYPAEIIAPFKPNLKEYNKSGYKEVNNRLDDDINKAVFKQIFKYKADLSISVDKYKVEVCPHSRNSVYVFVRSFSAMKTPPIVTDLWWKDFPSGIVRTNWPESTKNDKYDLIPVTSGITKKQAAAAEKLLKMALRNDHFTATADGFSVYLVPLTGPDQIESEIDFSVYLAEGQRPYGKTVVFTALYNGSSNKNESNLPPAPMAPPTPPAPILEAPPSVVPQTMAKNDPPLSEIRSEDIEKIEGQYHATQAVKKLIRESFDSGLLKNYTVTSSKRIRLEFQQPKNGVVEVLVSKMETDANNFVNPKQRRYQKVFVYLKKRF